MTTATPRPQSIAIAGISRFDTLWYAGRINRGLDQRDSLLAQGIERLTSRRPDQGFATVSRISPEVSSPAVGGGVVSGTITGLSLLGSRLAKASKTFGTGNSALTFEAVLPGPGGNDIEITIENTGADSITVTDTLIEITHSADTATTLAGRINAHAEAKYLVNVTAGGNGSGVVADSTTATALTGGTGPDDLILGELPVAAAVLCGNSSQFVRVTSWTATTISVDINPDDIDGQGTEVSAGEYPIILFVDGYALLAGVCIPRVQKTSPIDILSGVGDAGTWTKAATSGGLSTVTRTAAAAAQSFWVALPQVKTGDLILGVDANYSANTADLEDVRFEIWEETLGANGAAPTAAVAFGEDNADYDADHNTTAERGLDTAAPQLHRVIMRNAGDPVVAAAGKVYKLRVFVDGDAGPNGVFVLNNAQLLTA